MTFFSEAFLLTLCILNDKGYYLGITNSFIKFPRTVVWLHQGQRQQRLSNCSLSESVFFDRGKVHLIS